MDGSSDEYSGFDDSEEEMEAALDGVEELDADELVVDVKSAQRWTPFLASLLDIDLLSTVAGESANVSAENNALSARNASSENPALNSLSTPKINVNRVDGSQLNWLNPVTYLHLLAWPKQSSNGAQTADRNGVKRATFNRMRELTLVKSRRRILAIFTFYVLILRYSSTDAFIFILLFSYCLLLYYLKNARRINIQLAKRSVRQRVGWAKQWAGGFFKRGQGVPTPIGDGMGLLSEEMVESRSSKDEKNKKRRNPFKKSTSATANDLSSTSSGPKRLGLFKRNQQQPLLHVHAYPQQLNSPYSPQISSAPPLASINSTSLPGLADPILSESSDLVATTDLTASSSVPPPLGRSVSSATALSTGIAKKAASLFNRKRNDSLSTSTRPGTPIAVVSPQLNERFNSSDIESTVDTLHHPLPLLKKTMSASASLESIGARIKPLFQSSAEVAPDSSTTITWPSSLIVKPLHKELSLSTSFTASPNLDTNNSSSIIYQSDGLKKGLRGSSPNVSQLVDGAIQSISDQHPLDDQQQRVRYTRGHGRSISDSISPSSTNTTPTSTTITNQIDLLTDDSNIISYNNANSITGPGTNNRANRVSRVLGKAGHAAKGVWTHVKIHHHNSQPNAYPTSDSEPGSAPIDPPPPPLPPPFSTTATIPTDYPQPPL